MARFCCSGKREWIAFRGDEAWRAELLLPRISRRIERSWRIGPKIRQCRFEPRRLELRSASYGPRHRMREIRPQPTQIAEIFMIRRFFALLALPGIALLGVSGCSKPALDPAVVAKH